VNAGFRATVDSSLTIQGSPTLVFGGVKLSPVGTAIKANENHLHSKVMQCCGLIFVPFSRKLKPKFTTAVA
jgi:hypothetical protein